MNLLLRSAMIFFGTLMAAGLVALGEPPAAHIAHGASHGSPRLIALNRLADFARPWLDVRSAQPAR